MFGLSGIKMAIYGVVLGGVAALGIYAWVLKKDNAALIANNATLKTSLELEKEAAQAAKANAEEWKAYAGRVQDLQNKFVSLRAEIKKQEQTLDNIFQKHDLEALALAKPGLIELRVNRATDASSRLLERATALGRHGAAGTGEATGETDGPAS